MSYTVHQPAAPNAEDKWSAAEHNGNLLAFFPIEVRRGIKTSNGDTDAVRCARVVNLDTGRILHDTLIFGTALVPNIGPAAPDGVVLGRLGQGQGKNGNNPPWILLPHDEADLGRFNAWVAQDIAGNVAQPQPQAQQQGAWGQPPAAAPAPAWGAPQAQPNTAQAGWGAPAAAPAAPAWGAPAPAPAQQAPSAWSAPAPAAGPAPDVHPGLVEALRKKGVPLDQLTSQAQAEQIWAVVQAQPDVVA